MIKFFRKIRQQLLTENKFSKYLLYAVGEIILVVIGILIALSINNWNEQRKIENQGKEYIGEIYGDLKNEISNLKDIVSGLQKQFQATENALKIFESHNHLIRDSLEFTNNLWAAEKIFITQRDQNTFDKLRTSGLSGIIKNDSIIGLLDTFYKEFDIRITNFNQYPTQVRMELRRITFPMGNSNDFKDGLLNGKFTKAYIKEYLNSEESYEILLSIYKTSYYNIGFFEKSLVEANNLIIYLEEEYSDLVIQK
jgi:hypothetical protein